MRDAAYCRAQALKCRELAMGIEDPGMVEHLVTIAAEYEAEGLRLERQVQATQPKPFPEQ